MKMIAVLAGIAVLGAWGADARAEYSRIGSASCQVIDIQGDRVSAEIFGSEPLSGEPARIVYADISYTRTDARTGRTATVRRWNRVRKVDEGFSVDFVGPNVKLAVWFDDVGGMSSIEFERRVFTLSCSLDIE